MKPEDLEVLFASLEKDIEGNTYYECHMSDKSVWMYKPANPTLGTNDDWQLVIPVKSDLTESYRNFIRSK